MVKPKVLLISTGGTISSKYDEKNGYAPSNDADDFKKYIDDNNIFVDLEIVKFSSVLSFALKPEQIMNLVIDIKKKLKSKAFHGAIITQGTATMEETSYLADLLWDIENPLVFTGAMINASEKDSDGERNVLNSILVAADPLSKNKGVLVCMGGEIHAARDVSKSHKTRINAFESLNNGALGIVNDGRVVYYRNSSLRKSFSNVRGLESRVEIVKVSLGSSSKLIDTLIYEQYKGIVIEGFPGGGGVTPEIMDSIRKAQQKDIVFVLTPRSIMGSTLSRAAGGCGPWDLRQSGVINGGDLSSVKARILLMIALKIYSEKAQIKKIFDELAP